MKNVKISLLISLLALILPFGCQKENRLAEPLTSATYSGVMERSEDERTALNAHVETVKAFREVVHQWRENSSGEGMSAREVVEKTEIAFNLFIGRPTTIFESYALVETEIPVVNSEQWSAGEVVSFYGAVKQFVSLNLGQHNQLQMISLGNPVNTQTGSSVKVILNIGTKPVSSDHTFEFIDGTRWGKSPIGFTNPTPCGGVANTDIGAAANQQIGIYNAINAGPGSGGNTPLPNKIVSRIVFGTHSLFGFNFPQGTNYPEVYNIATFGTPLASKHYNDISLPVGNPDWNCLTNVELITLGFGNIDLAANGQLFVPPFIFGPFSINRRVVCTGVGAFAANAITPGVNEIEVKFQDHPTRHYFGVVTTFIVPDEDVDDM